MKSLPGLGPAVPVVRSHQGGWDEALLIFGVPIAVFVLLRWLGARKQRRVDDAPDEEVHES